MNEQITNPKVEMPKGMNINDKDYVSELLSGLKAMTKNYAVALTEASNETLYSAYKNMFEDVSNMQREVYELMFRYGWYPMEKADQNKITSKQQMLTGEWSDLNQGNI